MVDIRTAEVNDVRLLLLAHFRRTLPTARTESLRNPAVEQLLNERITPGFPRGRLR
jgi:hypothetical protein